MNLIPDKAAEVPNYWCTWSLQNYIYGQNNPDFEIKELEGALGANHGRSNFTEDFLFGDSGYLTKLYPKNRQDLLVILDDGWDVPTIEIKNQIEKELYGLKYFSSFYLDSQKFPSFPEKPEERLKDMVEKVKSLGWKGLGVWVAAQRAWNYLKIKDIFTTNYWKDRLRWSEYANLSYWKVDWGILDGSLKFRKFLTRTGKKIAPHMIIEHAQPSNPINNGNSVGRVSLKYIKKYQKLLQFSECVRLYDVSTYLSIPTTLDRIVSVFQASESNPRKSLNQTPNYINVEDEVYIAAVLGCTMGVMRYPFHNLRMKNGIDIDFPFQGSRQIKRRIDEVSRALNWHRIAPPFGTIDSIIKFSDKILFDSWHFLPGQFWDKRVFNKTIQQGAPKIIARNMELPQVVANDEHPFVIASLNPNGAVSIATLGRTSPEKSYYHPLAKVSITLDTLPPFIGIFGYFDELEVNFTKDIAIRSILGQDLNGSEAQELNNEVSISKRQLIISGNLITNIGLSAASLEDISDPGLVLKCLES